MMATRIGKLTSIWKSYNDEVVGLEEDIRIAYSKIKRLDAKIENIQAQIAFLQEQE
jgi:hypothetical protein